MVIGLINKYVSIDTSLRLDFYFTVFIPDHTVSSFQYKALANQKVYKIKNSTVY